MTLAARAGGSIEKGAEPALEMPLEHGPLANAPQMAGPDACPRAVAPLAEQRVDRCLRDAPEPLDIPGLSDRGRLARGRLLATTAATSIRRPSRLSGTCAQAWTASTTACRAGSSVSRPGIPVADGTAVSSSSAVGGAVPSSHFGSWCTSTTSGRPGQDERAKVMDSDDRALDRLWARSRPRPLRSRQPRRPPRASRCPGMGA